MSLANGGGTFVSDITSTTNQQVDDTGTFSYTVNSDGTVTTVQDGVPVVQFVIINSDRFVTINDVTGVYPYLRISQQ